MEYTAKVTWEKSQEEDFTSGKYSRGHQWAFDGGLTVPASASPHIVPLPFSVERNVDPEEAFVAAISSCHMLFFLHFAAKDGFTVESYEDNAAGKMAKDDRGKISITEVTLKPTIHFSGAPPSKQVIQDLHHHAHEHCFIANSVKTRVTIHHE